MKDYIGHHTCKQDGGKEYVLENAPFFSAWKANSPTTPFLGSGYYFWDYDVNQAKKWGTDHYKSSYYILQAIIHTTDENFLDLVGDRTHMEYLLKMAKRFAFARKKPFDWKLGELIEILKRASKTDTAVFPFQIIRAQDYAIYIDHEFKYFFRDSYAWTYLNPRHIFCLITVNNVLLSNKEIIFESKK